jgi:hypothetical protein
MASIARQECRVSVNGLTLLFASDKYVNAGVSCFGEESQAISGRKEEGQLSRAVYPKISKSRG